MKNSLNRDTGLPSAPCSSSCLRVVVRFLVSDCVLVVPYAVAGPCVLLAFWLLCGFSFAEILDSSLPFLLAFFAVFLLLWGWGLIAARRYGHIVCELLHAFGRLLKSGFRENLGNANQPVGGVDKPVTVADPITAGRRHLPEAEGYERQNEVLLRSGGVPSADPVESASNESTGSNSRA